MSERRAGAAVAVSSRARDLHRIRGAGPRKTRYTTHKARCNMPYPHDRHILGLVMRAECRLEQETDSGSSAPWILTFRKP